MDSNLDFERLKPGFGKHNQLTSWNPESEKEIIDDEDDEDE